MLWMHGRVRPCVHKDFYHCSSLGIRKDLRPRYVIKMLVCRRKTNYCLSPLTAKVFSKQFIFTFFCTICTSKQQKPNQGVHFLSTQRFIASRRPKSLLMWCTIPLVWVPQCMKCSQIANIKTRRSCIGWDIDAMIFLHLVYERIDPNLLIDRYFTRRFKNFLLPSSTKYHTDGHSWPYVI